MKIFPFLSLLAILSLSGCMAPQSTQFGNQIDSNTVSHIQKGVTTRAEVEARLGAPQSVAMMGDGRRILYYSFSDGNLEANGVGKASGTLTALSWLGMLVPVPGASALGTAGAVGSMGSGQNNSTRMQSLSICINGENIVDDYEFSDNTMNQATGPFGSQTKMTANIPDSSATGQHRSSSGESPFAPKRLPTTLLPGTGDVASKLKSLKDLKESGVLTDDEYQAKRKAIIDKL